MSEDLHRGTRLDPQFAEQRRARVPGAVRRQVAQAGRFSNPVKGSIEITRLDLPPRARGDDQTGFLPILTALSPPLLL